MPKLLQTEKGRKTHPHAVALSEAEMVLASCSALVLDALGHGDISESQRDDATSVLLAFLRKVSDGAP